MKIIPPTADGLGLLLMLSHLIMVFAWSWATSRLWKLKDLPHGNHVLAAGVAMVLAQGAMLLQTRIPIEILVYFVAMAQVTLVISFVRLTKNINTIKNTIKSKVGKIASLGLVLASISNLLLAAR
jgi:hypothetical protein